MTAWIDGICQNYYRPNFTVWLTASALLWRLMFMPVGMLVFVSCASYPELNSRVIGGPIQDASSAEILSITLADHGSVQEELRFLRLDGERSKRFQEGRGVYLVPHGRRELKIQYAVINRGRLIREAFCTLEADLERGKRYIPYAKRDDEDWVEVWLMDALSAEPVTESVTLRIEMVEGASTRSFPIPPPNWELNR